VDVLSGNTERGWLFLNVDGDGDPTKRDKVTELASQQCASDLDSIAGP
jgi:hypothetical protein